MFIKNSKDKRKILLNNISVIESFLITERNDKLIINQVSEEIGTFYKNFIYRSCAEKGINVILSNRDEERETEDLFKKKELKICLTNSAKDIENVLSKREKFIVITDYKIFKKYSNSLLSVNGYNYEKDIKYYVQNNLKISNLDILEFCISTPQLVFSETSKFLVNSKGYVKETKINERNNPILELRKELFNLKRKKGDLRKAYEILKNEAKFKKLNFLAY